MLSCTVQFQVGASVDDQVLATVNVLLLAGPPCHPQPILASNCERMSLGDPSAHSGSSRPTRSPRHSPRNRRQQQPAPARNTHGKNKRSKTKMPQITAQLLSSWAQHLASATQLVERTALTVATNVQRIKIQVLKADVLKEGCLFSLCCRPVCQFPTCCRCDANPRTTEAKPRNRLPSSISWLKVSLAFRASSRRLFCAASRLSMAARRAWRRLPCTAALPPLPVNPPTTTFTTGYGLRAQRSHTNAAPRATH